MGSILQTGSDTTLYVVSLYYGSIHLKKYSYTLWLGFFLRFSFICFYALFLLFRNDFVEFLIYWNKRSYDNGNETNS